MYIIRADGNAKIGMGHLMRCLTIALAMKNAGVDNIAFLCADEASAEVIRRYKMRVEVLNTDYRRMQEELPAWEELFGDGILRQTEGTVGVVGKDENAHSEQPGNVILVDSYYVDNTYLRGLKKYGRVYLMDDMQQCTYDVDGIINYNVFASRDIYEELYRGTGTRLIVGKRYVPIRAEFLEASEEEYSVKAADKVTDILITTGGGDVDNIAGRILTRIWKEDINYHLVVGRFNPHLEELKEMGEAHSNIVLHHDVQDMAGLMRSCDFAVTAGGSTVYELAALGVPFVCFSYAENQEALVNFVGEQEGLKSAGAYHKDAEKTLENIGRTVEDCVTCRDARMKCSLAVRDLLDCKGAQNLAHVLIGEE